MIMPWLDLVFDWIDTGHIDPRLVQAICDQVARFRPDEIESLALSGQNQVERLIGIPGGISFVRSWIGKDRLSRLAAMSPADMLKAVNAVIDGLLERYPAHGLVVWEHKDWFFTQLMQMMEALAPRDGAGKRKVVELPARTSGE